MLDTSGGWLWWLQRHFCCAAGKRPLLGGGMRNCGMMGIEMSRKDVKVPDLPIIPYFWDGEPPTLEGKRRLAPCVYVAIFILPIFLG